MRAAFVLVLALAAVASVAAIEGDVSHELDEIEQIDSSVFRTEQASPMAKSPIEQAAAAAVSARDADLDSDTEAVAALAADSGLGAGADADESTLFSFRAMRRVSDLSRSSISEKSAETHAAAMRILKGGKTTADELFAEINREQQILAAKRVLVSRQKQSIADSEESLARLQRLIGDNKSVLHKNEKALRRASDDLLQLISKYQSKLRAGISKEVGGAAASEKGPLKSRPHQRAAFTKWAERGARKVDTTKSDAQLAAANTQSKAAAGKPAAAKPAAAKPAAKPAAAAAPKKMKFVETHADIAADAEAEDEASDEEVAAEAASVEAAAEEAEAESAESESEEDEEEADEEEEEEEDESEADSEESEESEESEAALVESGATADLTMSRDAVLPGLAPPPHLYDEAQDSFVF